VAGRWIGEDETDQDSPEPMRRPTGTIPLPASGFSQAEHDTLGKCGRFILGIHRWLIPVG
jgi:hypothetical protein